MSQVLCSPRDGWQILHADKSLILDALPGGALPPIRPELWELTDPFKRSYCPGTQFIYFGGHNTSAGFTTIDVRPPYHPLRYLGKITDPGEPVGTYPKGELIVFESTDPARAGTLYAWYLHGDLWMFGTNACSGRVVEHCRTTTAGDTVRKLDKKKRRTKAGKPPKVRGETAPLTTDLVGERLRQNQAAAPCEFCGKLHDLQADKIRIAEFERQGWNQALPLGWSPKTMHQWETVTVEVCGRGTVVLYRPAVLTEAPDAVEFRDMSDRDAAYCTKCGNRYHNHNDKGFCPIGNRGLDGKFTQFATRQKFTEPAVDAIKAPETPEKCSETAEKEPKSAMKKPKTPAEKRTQAERFADPATRGEFTLCRFCRHTEGSHDPETKACPTGGRSEATGLFETFSPTFTFEPEGKPGPKPKKPKPLPPGTTAREFNNPTPATCNVCGRVKADHHPVTEHCPNEPADVAELGAYRSGGGNRWNRGAEPEPQLMKALATLLPRCERCQASEAEHRATDKACPAGLRFHPSFKYTPEPTPCEFCHKITDHGRAEIERLKALGWSDTLPTGWTEKTKAKWDETTVPYCGNSATNLWRPKYKRGPHSPLALLMMMGALAYVETAVPIHQIHKPRPQ